MAYEFGSGSRGLQIEKCRTKENASLKIYIYIYVERERDTSFNIRTKQSRQYNTLFNLERINIAWIVFR